MNITYILLEEIQKAEDLRLCVKTLIMPLNLQEAIRGIKNT